MITIQDTTAGDEIYCRPSEVADALFSSGWFSSPDDETRQAISEFGVRVAVGAAAGNYEAFLGVRVLP